MLYQVEHANGVTETIATKAAFPMQRPHQITTTGASGGDNWSSGIYRYDGAGNVKEIGSQRYQYDRMNRLVMGEVQVGAQEKTQSLVYDAFGNITSLTTDGSLQSTPVDVATNRLSAATNSNGLDGADPRRPERLGGLRRPSDGCSRSWPVRHDREPIDYDFSSKIITAAQSIVIFSRKS